MIDEAQATFSVNVGFLLEALVGSEVRRRDGAAAMAKFSQARAR
jgi:hypothetical protein